MSLRPNRRAAHATGIYQEYAICFSFENLFAPAAGGVVAGGHHHRNASTRRRALADQAYRGRIGGCRVDGGWATNIYSGKPLQFAPHPLLWHGYLSPMFGDRRWRTRCSSLYDAGEGWDDY